MLEKSCFAHCEIGFFLNVPYMFKEKQVWKLKAARRKKTKHIKRGKEISESSTDKRLRT